jgi:hypothetical protein
MRLAATRFAMEAVLDLAAATTKGASVPLTSRDIRLVGRLFVSKAANGRVKSSVDEIQHDKANQLGFSLYLHVI